MLLVLLVDVLALESSWWHPLCISSLKMKTGYEASCGFARLLSMLEFPSVL